MATLSQLVSDDNDLATEVTALIAAYEAVIAAQAGGTLTPAQQAQVDSADATLQATKATVLGALNPTPTPTPNPTPGPVAGNVPPDPGSGSSSGGSSTGSSSTGGSSTPV